MSKLFDKEGLIGMWQSIKQRLSNCVTRIWWDTSSEIYMYDTFGQSDLDFPIQEVKTDSSKPGLMTAQDKVRINNVVNTGFVTGCSVKNGSIMPQDPAALVLSVSSVNKSDLDKNNLGLGIKTISENIVPVATSSKNGVMSAGDKKILNEIASFGKATTNPYTSHPFVFEYCKMMDMDIVMTVGGINLWCVTVLLDDTEDQRYVATYEGKILGQKSYSYGYTNTSDGDITTWFLALPTTAAKGSCAITVS